MSVILAVSVPSASHIGCSSLDLLTPKTASSSWALACPLANWPSPSTGLTLEPRRSPHLLASGLLQHSHFSGALCQVIPGLLLDIRNSPAFEEDGRPQHGVCTGLTVCGAQIHNEWLLLGVEGDAGMDP